MNQPREAISRRPEPAYGCDRCTFRSDDQRDFGYCEAPGCPNDRVCTDCITECDDCGRFFCKQDIIETPMPGARVYMTYRCEPCQLKHERTAA